MKVSIFFKKPGLKLKIWIYFTYTCKKSEVSEANYDYCFINFNALILTASSGARGNMFSIMKTLMSEAFVIFVMTK